MIRFLIKNVDESFVTEWHEEVLGDLSTQTAAQQIKRLRQEYPDAEISVERSEFIPRKKQPMVRFQIAQKDDRTMYSIGVPAEHREPELLRLQAKFPGAKITVKEFEV